jgi:UDP-N-acetylmuramyl pentapeptide synthase
VDRVLLLGEKFCDLYQTSPEEHHTKSRISVFRDRNELKDYLQSDRPEGYHILVKGSRVNELEKIVPLL